MKEFSRRDMERNSHTDIEIIHFNFLFEGCLYMNIHVNATLTIHIFFLKEKIMLFEWIDYLFPYIYLVIPSSNPFENQCSGTSGLWSAHSIWTKVCYHYRCIAKNTCKGLEFSLDFLHVVLLPYFKSQF